MMEMYQQNELLPFFIVSAILFTVAGFFGFYLIECAKWDQDERKQVLFAFFGFANILIVMVMFVNMVFISGPLISMLPDGFFAQAAIIGGTLILFFSLIIISIQITRPIRQK